MSMKNPPHPGGVVLRECIEPLGLTITNAAAALGVTRTTLSELVAQEPCAECAASRTRKSHDYKHQYQRPENFRWVLQQLHGFVQGALLNREIAQPIFYHRQYVRALDGEQGECEQKRDQSETHYTGDPAHSRAATHAQELAGTSLVDPDREITCPQQPKDPRVVNTGDHHNERKQSCSQQRYPQGGRIPEAERNGSRLVRRRGRHGKGSGVR
jgi:hypothetical protein